MATPYADPSEWSAVNRSLAAAVRKLSSGHLVRAAAAEMQLEIIWLDWPAGRISALTCPDCADVCCRRAWVYFDRTDLFFLHLRNLPVPTAQTIAAAGRTCRFLTDRGCRLPRVNRPWLCTWYLCPDQIAGLAGRSPIALKALESGRSRVNRLRRLLREFVGGVS